MFMIKNDDQRQKTLKRIEGLKAQIIRIRREQGRERAEDFRAGIQAHLRQLEEQVQEYDRLRKEGPGPFRPQHLSEVGSYFIKARIASGVTQAKLAERLGVSQPMVYKYEIAAYQGVNLAVLSKVAKILGVSLDLEVFSVEAKQKSYSAVRQEATILYFIQQINNKFLGRTKLMKLLYYADYEWVQKTGTSITGDSYLAMQYGPMPKHGPEVLKGLEKRKAIRVGKVKAGDYDQERYVALEDPDVSLFSREEVDHLGEISRRFEYWTATQMSELSHEDWPWKSTPFGKEISFFSGEIST